MQQGATLGGGATGSFHRTASHAKDKGGAAAGAERSDLFDTPSELLCPITQDLLIDPVLTTSGQVRLWTYRAPTRAARVRTHAMHASMHACERARAPSRNCATNPRGRPCAVPAVSFRWCVGAQPPPLPCSSLTQVYERAAIETHLARAAAVGTPLTDPLTNSPLDSDQLLPVFPMRSRVSFRDCAESGCLQGACMGWAQERPAKPWVFCCDALRAAHPAPLAHLLVHRPPVLRPRSALIKPRPHPLPPMLTQ